ncbi:hypothetical protein GS935_09115 [Rhodococcus hoagii]|nr:hypothetical protein [Prescottella equi]
MIASSNCGVASRSATVDRSAQRGPSQQRDLPVVAARLADDDVEDELGESVVRCHLVAAIAQRGTHRVLDGILSSAVAARPDVVPSAASSR